MYFPQFTWKRCFMAATALTPLVFFLYFFISEALDHENEDTYNSSRNEMNHSKCADPHDHDISLERCKLLHTWKHLKWISILLMLARQSMGLFIYTWSIGLITCQTEVCMFLRQDFYLQVSNNIINMAWFLLLILFIYIWKWNSADAKIETKLKTETYEQIKPVTTTTKITKTNEISNPLRLQQQMDIRNRTYPTASNEIESILRALHQQYQTPTPHQAPPEYTKTA